MEIQEPKLFIQSPPFYFVDVNETAAVQEQTFFEESTSVYEISRTEKIDTLQNEVVFRQLNYFSQPLYRNRNYMFHLEDGEKIIGKIEELDGVNVKVKTPNNLIIIDGNNIKAITITRAY